MTEREAQLVSRDEKIHLLEERIEQLEDENDNLNTELRNTGERIDSIQKGTEERVAQFDELRIQLEKVECILPSLSHISHLSLSSTLPSSTTSPCFRALAHMHTHAHTCTHIRTL